MSLPQVNPMPAIVCHACAWWAYDVKPDSPRGGHDYTEVGWDKQGRCKRCRSNAQAGREMAA